VNHTLIKHRHLTTGKSWMLSYLLVFTLFFLGTSTGEAVSADATAPPIILETSKESYQLGKHLDILEDKEAKLTIEQVTEESYY